MKRRKNHRLAFSALCIGMLSVLACAQAPPMVEEGITQKVEEGVYVIPDRRVNLVPNVGIVVGERGVLVVDTGMGPANAERVLREVRKITSKEILYLTITHFHPEHGMGAQAFPPSTRMVVPRAQRDELEAKGADYIKLFSGFNPQIADLLKPVKLVAPDIVFEHQLELNLGGGMVVRLLHFNAGHTRGDSFVYLPKQKILFGGDVVVNRFFPILPDADASPLGWLKTLDELEKLAPAKIVPGHGEVGDASLIRDLRQYLVCLRGRVQELDAKGKPLADIITVLTPEVQAKYKDWDNPTWIKNAIERTYAELRQP
ncbi:MAG: MBL fold metallo-hydrolase [Terriglobales bacterium]